MTIGFNELTLQNVPPCFPIDKILHDHCSSRQSAFEIHLTDPSNDNKQIINVHNVCSIKCISYTSLKKLKKLKIVKLEKKIKMMATAKNVWF